VLGLYDSCDVIVSLHRSEGLGLSLLEGMSLGKPVVGTAWSGNMDFMGAEDSALVPYTLVDMAVPAWSPYHRRSLGVPARWAEPDVAAAAEWMRRLAGDRALRSQLGDAARKRVDATRIAFGRGEVVKYLSDRLERLRGSEGERARVQALGTLRRTHLWTCAALAFRGLRRRAANLARR
jgi:glycosyltransferase involved in cell wall biosynthesis